MALGERKRHAKRASMGPTQGLLRSAARPFNAGAFRHHRAIGAAPRARAWLLVLRRPDPRFHRLEAALGNQTSPPLDK